MAFRYMFGLLTKPTCVTGSLSIIKDLFVSGVADVVSAITSIAGILKCM